MQIPFNSIAFDTLGGTFNSSTHAYTVARTGYYRISATGYSTTPGTGSERYAVGCHVAGALMAFTGGNYSVSDTPLAGFSSVQYVDAGQAIDMWIFSAIAANLGAGNSGGHQMFWDMEYLGN